MSPTGIEWVRSPDGSRGITVNSKTGCQNHTPEGLCQGGLFPCYAYRLANGRLKPLYLANKNVAPRKIGTRILPRYDPFYPRFWEERLKQPYQVKKPIGIFLDDMSDWMLDCWPREWTEAELQMMRDNSQHRIYTLTKQPQNLIKFSPFPENCWVGVTATNGKMLREALVQLEQIKASVKYVSLEPLLAQAYDPLYFLNSLPDWLSVIDWLIIGACTGTYTEMWHLVGRLYPLKGEADFVRAMRIKELSKGRYTLQPSIEWLQEIVQAADKAGVKVFQKDNLKPLLGDNLRQEMPI